MADQTAALPGAANGSESAPKVSFVRRGKAHVLKSVIKKVSHTEMAEDADDEKGIDQNRLRDMKLIHEYKTLTSKEGVDLTSFNQVDKTAKLASQKTADSSFSAQFDRKMDYGIQLNIPHENIMNAFIESKLTASDTATAVVDASTPAVKDELYSIPEELRVTTTDTAAKQVRLEEEQGVASSWSTGIAEVALPIAFKLKNIEATEKAAQQARSQHHHSQLQSTRFPRFQSHDDRRAPLPLGTPDDIAASMTASRDEDHRHKRALKSTDDFAVHRFKKQMLNKR